MQNLSGKTDLDTFFRALREAPARALLLDFDGTLAPFRPDPASVVMYEGVAPILDEIASRGTTRLVLITGRAVDAILPLLPLGNRPEIWGSHGLERLGANGDYDLAPIPSQAREGLEGARRWAEVHDVLHKCDEKPGCLALNFRGLDADLVHRLKPKAEKDWSELVRTSGLALHPFDGGIELRVPGRNKGDAVRTVRSEMPDGARLAYLGDDLTDEDAFKALGSQELGVLVRGELRPTAADVWLEPPAELLHFLQRWRHSSNGDPPKDGEA